MKRALLLVLLLAVCFYGKAQTSHLYFDRLDVKTGLPENTVRSIVEDSEGYIWISTQNGLVRYDGYNYKVYTLGSDKTNPRPTTNVISVVTGDDKSIWVSAISNGLFRYDRTKDSFEQFIYPSAEDKYSQISVVDDEGNPWGIIRHENSVRVFRLNAKTKKYDFFSSHDKGSNFINSPGFYPLVKLQDHSIWMGTDNGVYKFDGTNKPLTSFLTVTDTAKYAAFNPIYEAPSQPGVIWANGFHGQNIDLRVSAIDKRTGKLLMEYRPSHNLDSIFNTSISSIYEDKKHRLWFAADHALSKLDRSTGKFTNYLSGDTTITQLNDIVEDKNGKLWLSSSAGALQFDPDNGTYQLFRAKSTATGSLNLVNITKKIIDHTNTLWLASHGNGVNRISKIKSAFEIITHNDKPGSYPGGWGGVISSAPNLNRIFTYNGVFNWQPATNQFNKIYSVPAGGNINSAVDDNNIIYIGVNNALTVYNAATGGKTVYKNNPADSTSMVNSPIEIIRKDHTGIIWVGTNSQGICAFDPATKKFTRYPFHTGGKKIFDKNDGSLDDSRVIAIYEDMQNTLWVGTNEGGLNKFDRKTGKFLSYFDTQNKKMTCVSALFEDREGRFWVGTYQLGLFEFDRKNGVYTHHVDERSGLLHNNVIGIREDSIGRLWVSTERGLTRIEPKTMALWNYKTEDILPGAKFYFLNKISLADGRFVASTDNGFALFNPRDLDDNEYPPIVHIEGIRYNGPGANDSLAKQAIRFGLTRLELSHDQNSVQFNYVGLHYENPSNNVYAYMLEGYDKQWVNAGTNRSVTYNNLPPGTYTFKVKAANSSGVWDERGDSIIVIISPPWWFTWWAWVLYAVLLGAAIYAYVQYRSRQLKEENQLLEEKVQERTDELQVVNKELSEQQLEITSQRDQLSATVNELKAAQQQLIQSEKLASLGELTAGIAHEIQNPLNFVNNFSEVSIELAVEMKQELRSGSKKEALSLADDIVLNLEKIVLHGKRADGIVKNMLQHSRTNTGEKHETDMNALVDEYLRLSYHGLRAKDKNFNSDMVLDLDPDLPKLKVIPQDIGRVMLNLFNNAFYAVQLKKKTAGKKYKPLVEVSTSLFTPPKGKSEIRIYVKDNGNGIPEANKEKIMQPFFTTKPAGEGTGLGLSLSYDIVVKGHRGKMDMSSKEGEYTEFTIHLPVA